MSQQTDFINSISAASVKRDKMIGSCWDKGIVSYKPHHIDTHTQCLKQENLFWVPLTYIKGGTDLESELISPSAALTPVCPNTCSNLPELMQTLGI